MSADNDGWTLLLARPGKRIWSRVEGGELVIREDWLEEVPLAQAAAERELAGGRRFAASLAPVIVIPDSVIAESLRDGWYHDAAKWRQFANDIDNRRLRVTEGRV